MLLTERIQSDSQRSGASDPAVPYAIALLLLPALVLCWRDDPLYSPLWQSDPWFYLGYFRDLVNFKRDLFPGFYYGSRLSWILPGVALHSLFPPLIANAVMHLTAHSVAVLSLFSILRSTAGLRGAYLTAMVFSFHPWIWCATGWDHVNGGAIAYYLLAMAMLTRAALRPARVASLILAGMALAGALYAHLFMVALTPLLLFYYVGMTGSWDLKGVVQRIGVASGWLAVGFLALTVPLAGINYLFVDGNPWFWTPSFKTARAVVQNYIWGEDIWWEGRLSPFLWFVVAGSAIAVVVVLSRVRRGQNYNRAALLFSIQLLSATAFLVYLQSRGITLLGHYYYACYLLPFVFLVFGASFWPAMKTMPRRWCIVTCVIATLVFGALWYNPAVHPLDKLLPQWGQLLLAGTILAVALALHQRMYGAFLAIAGLAILTSVIYTGNFRFVDLHSTRAEYLDVMNARKSIEERRNNAAILFWYDRNERPYWEYCALNASYMAEFARINENFPRGCSTPVEPGTLVVVTSDKEHSPELARAALSDCWQPLGLHATLESEQIIRGQRGPYTMAMLRVEAGAPAKIVPGELFRAIPLNQVQVGAPGAALVQTPEGLRVDTLPGFGAYAASVVLGLDPSLRVGLVLVVRIRVLEGKVGVGILDREGKSYLLESPVWAMAHATELVLPLPSRQLTGDLIICNRAKGNVPSSALIEKIEIRKMP